MRSEIFLSYKSEDQPRAKIIAEALEQHGYSVWWDRIIPPGKSFDEVIEEAINAAKCVIVLWSQGSVSSDWVKNEAREGNRRGILIPVLIDNVSIPFEFKHIQAAQLIDWKGDFTHPNFDLLLRSVGEILGKQPVIEEKVEISPYPENMPGIDKTEKPITKYEEDYLKKKKSYKIYVFVALILFVAVGIFMIAILRNDISTLSISFTRSPDSLVVSQTSWITLHVTKSDGISISGASINLSATGGSLNPSSGITDNNGDFKSIYTAPGTSGSYMITANASKTGYSGTTFLSQIIVNPSGFRIVEVNIRSDPLKYSGTCPVNITFSSRISAAGGGGIVSYKFFRSDGNSTPIQTLQFDTAGSKDINNIWQIGSPGENYSGWEAIKIFDPQEVESQPANFSIQCNQSLIFPGNFSNFTRKSINYNILIRNLTSY